MNDHKPWPEDWPPYHQYGRNIACDMLVGPCACGAWHGAGEFTFDGHTVTRLDNKTLLRGTLAEQSAERDLGAEAEQLTEEIRQKATAAAEYAVKNKVTVSVTASGKVRRNGPCPCGSGRKFKKCCLAEVRDPESDKKLPSPRAIRDCIDRQKIS